VLVVRVELHPRGEPYKNNWFVYYPVDKLELVEPDTLYVTHIFDNEEVVRGGRDGQTFVAVFASEFAAEYFVRCAVEDKMKIPGVRP